MLRDFINPNHKSHKRDYLSHMTADKPENMVIAKKYDKEFWDGDRKHGYGGYKDDGRWKSVATDMCIRYGLNSRSKVLDIGCGKGYLAYELNDLNGCDVSGCDISSYALMQAKNNKKNSIKYFRFEAGVDKLFDDYDLIISINTLHNLRLPNLKQAIQQINKHSKNAYICVEGYRNERELHNLQCWSLTAEQFFRPEEWDFLLKEWKYKGDTEYIYFE